MNTNTGQSDVFCQACIDGDLEQVKLLLSSHPLLANAFGMVDPAHREFMKKEGAEGGWSALHLAAHYGKLEVVKTLLAAGADLNAKARNKIGNTPILAAAAGRQTEVVNFLLKHGANPPNQNLNTVRLPVAVMVLLGLILLCSSLSGGIALLMGFILALTLGNPCIEFTRRWTPLLLQVSVVGLGASVNLLTVATVGLQGVFYTATGIFVTMLLGWALGKLIRTDHAITTLLSAGTAICGGSAIAAVAPVIRAKDHEVSVSLATVFFLNASALFLFPWIGHLAGLSQTQFGLWSALAIHDTSSVVGAAMQYGNEALEIATTVKLARALWIVPMTLAIGFLWSRRSNETGQTRVKKPWFILAFVLMSALVTWLPALRPMGDIVSGVSRRFLVLTLFLIGSGLSRATLRNVGLRPFVHGILLWICIGCGSFFYVFGL